MQESVFQNGFLSHPCPVDHHPLAKVPESNFTQVREAVKAGRSAQEAWSKFSFGERLRALRLAAKEMLARRQEALELLHDEVGKTPAEALMTEAAGPLQLLNDCAKVVKPYLKARKIPMSALAFPGKSAVTEIVPRGVVGVIAPWNYPLAYFFKPVFPALLCGNAVVLKPSEYSPRTALWFVKILNQFLPEGLLSCVVGGPEIGQALVRSGIDAITFTGSYASGREVAKLAADAMIPMSAELGGKDAAIILKDCALERTVRGVMQWALHNSGQACGAIDRVYVEAGIADRFVDELGQAVSRLRTGSGDPLSSDIGPLAHRKQLETVEELVNEALRLGAKRVCGGKRAAHGLWYEPTVLDHCHHGMRICREPTFGPVIPVIRVANADEAVALANDSEYGLCGSVWSQDLKRAGEIASRLQVGTAFINNHSFTGGVVSSPWTGVKRSGYGIANSVFSLGHYTRPRTQVVDLSEKPDIYWFPINGTLEQLGHALSDAQMGKIGSALKIPFLMARRRKEVARAFEQKQVAKAPPGSPYKKARRKVHFSLPLFGFEKEWVHASFEAIFLEPQGTPDPLPQVADHQARAEFDSVYAGVPFSTQLGMRLMIWILGVSPVFFMRRLATIRALPPRERVVALEKVNRSKFYLFRQAVFSLKALGALSHLKTTRVHRVKKSYAIPRGDVNRGMQL